MVGNEGSHPVFQGAGGAKLLQDFPGHFGAQMGVAPEVTYAVVVLGEASGLRHVVEEGRPPKGESRGNCGYHMGGVGVHIKDVVRIVLLEAQGRSQGGNRCQNDRGKGPKILYPGGGQKPAKLCIDPLPGQGGQGGSQGGHGSAGFGLRGELKPGSKADAPQNPQAILPEPLFRVGPQPAECGSARSACPPKGSASPRRGL